MHFHDYKTAGIERERLERWENKVGWETLLNRAGTTFRKLPDKDKTGLNAKKAIALMLAQPSMIKRPVLDLGGGKLLVGFAPELYAKSLSTARLAAICRANFSTPGRDREVPLPHSWRLNHGAELSQFRNC